MNAKRDFDTLKRKVYLAYHQDGILDLTAAVWLLGFGTFMLTGSVVFLTMGVIFATLYTLIKNRITVPRFGYVRFDSEKKSMTQALILLGIGVLVLLLVFMLPILLNSRPTSPEMQAWIQRYHMVPLSAALFAMPAFIAATLLGLKRFYLYALLAVGLPALGAWLNVETYLPILATGLVILAFGIWLLAGFLKNHPLDNKEGGHVNG